MNIPDHIFRFSSIKRKPSFVVWKGGDIWVNECHIEMLIECHIEMNIFYILRVKDLFMHRANLGVVPSETNVEFRALLRMILELRVSPERC